MKKRSNKIIIVYDYYSPAYKAGGPIQSLVKFTEQMRQAHDIFIVCSNKDLDGSVLNILPDTWIRSQDVAIYYSSKGAMKAISHVKPVQETVCFINGIYSLRFNLAPALLFRGKKIISVRGMLHPEALAQKAGKKALYLKAWKYLGLHRRCEYHATSEVEKEFIIKQFGKETRVWVVPNFPNSLPYCELPVKKENSLIICTVALISKMKNHLLVLQALKNCHFNITYNIFGPVKDREYWSSCQELIRSLPDNIAVNYHGSIPPELISEALSACHVYIQPSESENFGHSIYEALSAGRPVITSFSTPWHFKEMTGAGRNVRTKDSMDIAAAISHFAEMNEASIEMCSRSAREYALQSVNIPLIIKQYHQMFAASN